MTRYRVRRYRPARAGEGAGSTAAAIPIDYLRDTLEEMTALLQCWQHHFAPDAIAPLAGGDAPRMRYASARRARPVPGLVFRGLRRLASA